MLTVWCELQTALPVCSCPHTTQRNLISRPRRLVFCTYKTRKLDAQGQHAIRASTQGAVLEHAVSQTQSWPEILQLTASTKSPENFPGKRSGRWGDTWHEEGRWNCTLLLRPFNSSQEAGAGFPSRRSGKGLAGFQRPQPQGGTKQGPTARPCSLPTAFLYKAPSPSSFQSGTSPSLEIPKQPGQMPAHSLRTGPWCISARLTLQAAHVQPRFKAMSTNKIHCVKRLQYREGKSCSLICK